MIDLDSDRFELRRAKVDGVEITYVREGAGGFPLLLLHGWPETKRIWWRDAEALVRGELGHERCVVCAGDLGGLIAQDLSLRRPRGYSSATRLPRSSSTAPRTT